MKMKKAQSTLEILIALAILVISIGAVISVVFDNRFATIFSSQQHQALFLAEKQIEKEFYNYTNKVKELTKNPKVYLVDTGLRNTLLQHFELQHRLLQG